MGTYVDVQMIRVSDEHYLLATVSPQKRYTRSTQERATRLDMKCWIQLRRAAPGCRRQGERDEEQITTSSSIVSLQGTTPF